jgi:cyclopropane-fatty-acyl-phospholipid synthase
MTSQSLRRSLPLILFGVLRPNIARRAAEAALANLSTGRLTVHLPDGQVIAHEGPLPGPEAVISLHNWNPLKRLFLRGDVGFAESYIAGEWDTPDLTAALSFGAANMAAVHQTFAGTQLTRLGRAIGHALNRNTKKGSRRNIMAHYDLGNDFYRLWLDETMMYSSAIAVKDGQSLEAAQSERLERIRALLDLTPGMDVLEIGFGWGGLAVHLAQKGQVGVDGITLSPSQLAHAKGLAEESGVSEAVKLELRDYRDLKQTYDRVVSVEMFEAVGEAYWRDYFDVLRRSLKTGGRAVLQVITIAEDRFETYRSNPDFIQTHIFPGGMLPSRERLEGAVQEAGLHLRASETFGLGYAQTLENWRARFLRSWPEISALGFDERFRRLWLYYLSYCEAGFRTGLIDVGLYTIERPA